MYNYVVYHVMLHVCLTLNMYLLTNNKILSFNNQYADLPFHQQQHIINLTPTDLLHFTEQNKSIIVEKSQLRIFSKFETNKERIQLPQQAKNSIKQLLLCSDIRVHFGLENFLTLIKHCLFHHLLTVFLYNHLTNYCSLSKTPKHFREFHSACNLNVTHILTQYKEQHFKQHQLSAQHNGIKSSAGQHVENVCKPITAYTRHYFYYRFFLDEKRSAMTPRQLCWDHTQLFCARVLRIIQSLEPHSPGTTVLGIRWAALPQWRETDDSPSASLQPKHWRKQKFPHVLISYC